MSTILYKIRNWATLYENNRTRELKKLDWLPIPNKQDGDGYTLLMEQPDGAAIFGAWIACAQIASRCDPRGTLLRDGKKPHDSASLSRMSRIPVGIIESMLKAVSHEDVNWLEVIYLEKVHNNPAPPCDNPAPPCLEGKGREGNEGNERIDAREILTKAKQALEEAKVRIAKSYNRKPSDLWSYEEECLFLELSKRPGLDSETSELLAYRAKEPRYFSQSIPKLLSNWQSALDQARTKNGVPSAAHDNTLLARQRAKNGGNP